MSTHTLADGTEVPHRYDFNEHYKPLPVKNQGQDPTCYRHEHATLAEAGLRMWRGVAITIDPDRMEYAQEGGTAKRWTFPDHPDVEPLLTDYSGHNLWTDPAFAGLSTKEACIKALWLNGIIEGGVKMQHSYERLWAHPEKYDGWDAKHDRFTHPPQLVMLPGDERAITANTWAHAQPFPGYHWTKGLLAQNSWGRRFGMVGRCYIAWEAIEAGGIGSGWPLIFDGHPVNTLKLPPKRAA